MRDAIWLFANVQRPDNFTTPTTTSAAILADNPSPPLRKFQGWNWGLKASFTVSPQLNGFGYFSDSKAAIPGQTNSVQYRPRGDQRSGPADAALHTEAVWRLQLELDRRAAGRQEQAVHRLAPGERRRLDLQVAKPPARRLLRQLQQRPGRRPDPDAGRPERQLLPQRGGESRDQGGGQLRHAELPQLELHDRNPFRPKLCPSGDVCGATFTFNGFDASGNRIPFSQSVSHAVADLRADR